MKKTRFFIIFLLAIVLLCSFAMITACGGGENEDKGGQEAIKLDTPIVDLTDDIATWDADDLADKFEISIDGNLSYIENSVTSRKLVDGQTFKIRAIGDGTNYTNSDWSNSVTYVKPVSKYTITWKNGDTVLETDTEVSEGSVPVYNGTTPIKTADAQYSYVFAGWSPEVAPANGDVTYTAVFNSTVNKYTVTWKNGEDILQKDENIEYGTMPVYNGAEPQKAADAQYVYLFSGWSPVVSEVVGNVTYVAQFTSAPNSYTIVWKNGDAILETDENVTYGSIPSYDGVIPTKDETVQYTYTFSGWTPEINEVTESITYQAQFISTLKKYIITFYTEDGKTILDEVTVEYGSDVRYLKESPLKNTTEKYMYVFEKWVTEPYGVITDDLSNVVANRAVYASFKQYIRNVDVYIVPNNMAYGSVSTSVLNNIPYDSKIIINDNSVTINGETVVAIPEKSSVQYTYTFVEWLADETVDGETTITAIFSRSLNSYTVTWMNGTEILETDENVLYGTVPTYNGSMPLKSSTDGYTYIFSGWNPVVTSVNGNITYYAQFTDSVNKYSVTFYDDDGSTILGVVVVNYGESVRYPNDVPVKAETGQYTYTFDKWVTEVDGDIAASFENITENKSVYAKYSAYLKEYTVTFLDWNGSELNQQKVIYGDSALDPALNHGNPEREGYRFLGWDKDFDNITENLSVTAKYQQLVEVRFIDYDGSIIYSEYIDKDSCFVNVPEDPIRKDYKFTGWSIDIKDKIISDDLFVYAGYIRTYRVVFIDYDGTVLKSDSIEVNSSAIAPENPEREGYKFVGWNTEFDNVTSNLVVMATYEINRYTVTFVMPNGSVISQKSVMHGSSVEAPDVNSVYFHYSYFATTNQQYSVGNGYYFTGWDSSLEEGITTDKVITAVYGTIIEEPIIVVDKKSVARGQSKEVEICIVIVNGNAPCGISLDLQIDPTLFKAGQPTILIGDQKLDEKSEYCVSDFSADGKYTFRLTKNTGISNDTPVTFKFMLNTYENVGEYLIEILDSSYIITCDLEKITPVLISGAVLICE